MANTKFESILKRLFLKLNNTNILFNQKILIWRSYIINKSLLMTKNVAMIDKKIFVIAILDVDSKTFMVHIVI